MEAAFWLERWQQRQIGFHQEDINTHLMAHWSRLGVGPKSAVFVPLCGKTRDMQWVREKGHFVIGVELARTAIEEFFDEIGVEPKVSRDARFEIFEAPGYRLLCGDFFALEPADLLEVGAVFDRAALVALPFQMRTRYAEKLLQIAPMKTPTLLVSVTYPQEEMKGPPFSVDETEVRKLFAGSSVETLSDTSILEHAVNARFKERGLSKLTEQAYLIRRV